MRIRVPVIARVAGLSPAWAADVGKAAYDTYCAAGHQVTGEGV